MIKDAHLCSYERYSHAIMSSFVRNVMLKCTKTSYQLTILCILSFKHATSAVQHFIELDSIIHLYFGSEALHKNMYSNDIGVPSGRIKQSQVIWYCRKKKKGKKNEWSKSFGLPAVLFSYVRVCVCVTSLWTPKWKIHSPQKRLYNCEDWCVWQDTWVMMSTVIPSVAAIIIISTMKWHGA